MILDASWISVDERALADQLAEDSQVQPLRLLLQM